MTYPSKFDKKLRAKLDSMPILMTLKEASDVLFDDYSNAKCQAVKRFVKRGQFPAPNMPALNKGGSMYFLRQDIIDWYLKRLSNEN